MISWKQVAFKRCNLYVLYFTDKFIFDILRKMISISCLPACLLFEILRKKCSRAFQTLRKKCFHCSFCLRNKKKSSVFRKNRTLFLLLEVCHRSTVGHQYWFWAEWLIDLQCDRLPFKRLPCGLPWFCKHHVLHFKLWQKVHQLVTSTMFNTNSNWLLALIYTHNINDQDFYKKICWFKNN